jgi:hypothetical protein
MKRELTDVLISEPRNAIKKAAEKILKFTTQIQSMWNVKKKTDTINKKG